MTRKDVKHIFEADLRPQETLIWTDVPYPNMPASSVVTLLAMFIFVPVFGLLIFAVTQGLVTAFMSGDLLSIVVSIVLFLLFGLFPILLLVRMIRYIFFGFFECYGLTDKNILIRERLWPINVVKIPLDEIEKIFQLNAFPARTLCVLSKKGPSFNFISDNGMPAFFYNRLDCKAYYLRCLDSINTAENLINNAISSAKLNSLKDIPHE